MHGYLGDTIRSAFPDLRARERGGDTTLSGVFADQAALYGVLMQIEGLGLELIEVRRLPKGRDMMAEGSRADARDMFVVHRMFRRELGLMPGLVRAVAAGDSARAALVADHVALVSEGLAAHHQGEDHHIWPLLRERCPGQCAPLVAVMEAQHHATSDRLTQVAEAARSWRPAAPEGPRDVLAEAAGQLLAVTGDHLTMEEESVVPLIEKCLTQAEYLLAPQESQAVLPPGKLLIGLGMTLYGGTPDDVDAVIGHLPAQQRPAITRQAASAYAAYAEKLYGTATPPRTAN